MKGVVENIRKKLYLMFKTKNKPQSYTDVRQPDSYTRKNQDTFKML